MKHFTKSFTAIMFFLMLANFSEAQHYRQGQFVVDAFYGFPNMWSRYTLDNLEYFAPNGQATYSSIGPVGGRVEYLITESIGFGFDFSYANSSANDVGNGYFYKLSSERYRVLPRLNFHFGDHYNLDPYGTIGIGYYSNRVTYVTNDPYHTSSSSSNLFPISVRIGAGCRYFFNDHIGAGLELGVFGPLLTGGLTFKY